MPVQPLRGVISPILTPFDDTLNIAEDLYIAHAKTLLEQGCVGLAPFGTTGEALSVGIDERMHMLATLVDGGVDAAKLIPGTGLTNLPDTVRLTRQVAELGCAGALVLPPFFGKQPSDEGLFTYYARLVENVGLDTLRIYLYHIPQLAGVGIPVAAAERLHREFPDQIVGIKDSSGDWNNTKALLEIDGLTVYPGSEMFLIDAVKLGGAGCITGTANTNASAIAKVATAALSGEFDEAAMGMEAVGKFRQTMQAYDLIAGQKWLLGNKSGDKRWPFVRAPLESMMDATGQELLEKLAEV